MLPIQQKAISENEQAMASILGLLKGLYLEHGEEAEYVRRQLFLEAHAPPTRAEGILGLYWQMRRAALAMGLMQFQDAIFRCAGCWRRSGSEPRAKDREGVGSAGGPPVGNRWPRRDQLPGVFR